MRWARPFSSRTLSRRTRRTTSSMVVPAAVTGSSTWSPVRLLRRGGSHSSPSWGPGVCLLQVGLFAWVGVSVSLTVPVPTPRRRGPGTCRPGSGPTPSKRAGDLSRGTLVSGSPHRRRGTRNSGARTPSKPHHPPRTHTTSRGSTEVQSLSSPVREGAPRSLSSGVL